MKNVKVICDMCKVPVEEYTYRHYELNLIRMDSESKVTGFDLCTHCTARVRYLLTGGMEKIVNRAREVKKELIGIGQAQDGSTTTSEDAIPEWAKPQKKKGGK